MDKKYYDRKSLRISFLKHLKEPCSFDAFQRATFALDINDFETVKEERVLALDTMKKLGLGIADFAAMMESRLLKIWEL